MPQLNRQRTSDIYTAGIMLDEMVTGSHPLGPVAANDFALRVRIFDDFHLNVKPPLPSATAYGLKLPTGAEEIIMCALEKCPWNRFQTAEQMRRSIEACG